MRKITEGKKTVFVTDFEIPADHTAFGMALWCCAQLSRKCELDFESSVAEFLSEEDALKFEENWNG